MIIEQNTRRVALYLQDKHPIRDGMDMPAMPNHGALRQSGRPKAGWCVTPSCRWPPLPP